MVTVVDALPGAGAAVSLQEVCSTIFFILLIERPATLDCDRLRKKPFVFGMCDKVLWRALVRRPGLNWTFVLTS